MNGYIKVEIALEGEAKTTFTIPIKDLKDACEAGIYLLKILKETAEK